MNEYCGIFGITCNDPNFSVSGLIYSGLMAIQHRGQIFSGLSVYTSKKLIYSYKNRGIVSKVLNPKKLKAYTGNVGIGHVSCSGPRAYDVKEAQPYHFKSEKIEFSVAMNGIIHNYDYLVKELRNRGRIFAGKTDIELIVTLIETFSDSTNTWLSILKKLLTKIDGWFSLIILTQDGEIYSLRDPTAHKPLCYGSFEFDNKKFSVIASESCALDALGAKLIDDIKPGQIICINQANKISTYETEIPKNHQICAFEYIYFARPDSIIDGVSVFDARYNLGINLAKLDEDRSFKNTIVIPVPDSGRSAAMGYAWKSGLPYEEGLIKNRYVWQLKVSDLKEKLNTIKAVVEGHNIILIDDSIISGITMRKIIAMLKEADALSIHVRVSAPPIVNNCRANSNLSNRDLLIAHQKKLGKSEDYIEEIRKYIGADSLKYQNIEGLVKSIGLEKDSICKSCFDMNLEKQEQINE
ncbi:MAG: Amidophosphoribosyltransferase [Promethearchaeota archaeon]|nr:MAG: Amidophosphoribosyltransferase [Candidatus Lokiarchaeota archaeon]